MIDTDQIKKLKKPKFLKSELRALFDVDETLVTVKPHGIAKVMEFNYYGMEVKRYPYEEHIKFMQSLKQRGYHITVHSANGATWAKEVVERLELEDFVDRIETKPTIYVDDKEADKWMQLVFIND